MTAICHSPNYLANLTNSFIPVLVTNNSQHTVNDCITIRIYVNTAKSRRFQRWSGKESVSMR